MNILWLLELSNGWKRGFKMANGSLTYGDFTVVDPTVLPEASRTALMQYGLSHFLGNVQASKLVARIRGKEGMDNSEAGRDAVKAWREANADKITAWTKEHLDEAIAELTNGTIGTRVGGPRLDPVDKKFNSLVIAHITAQLKGVGRKLPKDDETVIDFGNGMTRTRSQMIANVKVNTVVADKLRGQAERAVRDEARLAKQVAEQAASVKDPTELGL